VRTARGEETTEDAAWTHISFTAATPYHFFSMLSSTTQGVSHRIFVVSRSQERQSEKEEKEQEKEKQKYPLKAAV
jgi:hypothetical protein